MPFHYLVFFLGNSEKLIVQGDEETNVLFDVHTGNRLKGSYPGIIFNTDGISPFKSSLLTVWPVLIALTNLPPSIRMNKDNIITVAVWAGQSKPNMHALFEPLKDLLDSLQNDGVTISTPAGIKVLKFRPAFGLFDLVAKAPILNMHQFNGVNGCPTCLHPGIWTASRYYLPEPHTLRTNSSVMKAAEDAVKQGIVVDGIKGKSTLSGIVDLVEDIPVDYMHCILEGVTKWLLGKWFTTSNSRSPFYIGLQVKNIDSNLLLQRPPHDFSRAPRSIQKHRNYWKASELRNWLLYYSLPLLEKVLAPLYFHHYSLFVCAIHILLQSRLSEVQVKAAEVMLSDFYTMLPELYGTNSCTLNAHSLIHLTYYVKLWGPLWTQSLFGFESFNGHLVNMIHSRHKIAEQVSFSIDVCQTIGFFADKLVEIENDQTLSFLKPMSSFTSRRNNMKLILPGTYSIGPLQSISLTIEEVHATSGSTITSDVITFKKLYRHNTILYTDNSEGKRQSSLCCFNMRNTKVYGCIQKFILSPPVVLIKPFLKTASSLLKEAGNPARDKLSNYAQANLLSTFFVQVKSELQPICAIPISAVLSKCVRISCKNSTHAYIIPIPNSFECH